MPYTDLSRMAPVRADYEQRHPERRTQDRHLDTSRNGSDSRKGRTPVERAAVRHQKVLDTPWWGLDGEGADYKLNGRRFQDYVSMSGASTSGEERELWHEGDRLGTHDCLWWLWKLPRQCRYTFYGAGYDWDKILCDLPRSKVEELYDQTRDPFTPVWWEDWGIINLRNAVTLVRNDYGRDQHKFFSDMWRCLGAGKFTNACKIWGICTPEELSLMEHWKERRSSFTKQEWKIRGDEIREYSRTETRALAQLAYKASVAASEVDLRPRQWYSSGSLGKALFKKHGVDKHRGPDRWAGAPEKIQPAIATAFGGGRFETSAVGPFGRLDESDLNSAYLAGMHQVPLPCLAHGSWRHGVHSRWNLRQVSWGQENPEEPLPWGPLPFRAPDGSVAYPTNGQTWSWATELDAAQTIHGYQWDEMDAWSWDPDCDHRPFDWIPAFYEQRLRLGKDGTGLILKGAGNSGYGTTADTVSDKSRFASTVWAGLITAGTRAELCKAIAAHPLEVIQTATDSVICSTPVMGTASNLLLGGWGYKGAHENVLIIQPGLYYAEKGLDRSKSRGHNYKEFEALIPALREQWDQRQFKGKVSYDRTRFITSKLALRRRDWSTRGQWVTSKVDIRFHPSNRFCGWNDPVGGLGALRTWPMPNLTGAVQSAPYKKLVSAMTHEGLLYEKLLAEEQP